MKKVNIEVRNSDGRVVQSSTAKWKSKNRRKGFSYPEGVDSKFRSGGAFIEGAYTPAKPKVYVEPTELTALRGLDPTAHTGALRTVIEYLQYKTN